MLEPAVASTCPLVPTEVGNIKLYDCADPCEGLEIETPCEFCEQFKVILPSDEEPSHFAVNDVAVITLSAIVVGNLASLIVPEVMAEPATEATLNVP